MEKVELLKRAKEIADRIEAKENQIAQCEIDIAHLQKEERKLLEEYQEQNRKIAFDDINPFLNLEHSLYFTGGVFYRISFDEPICHGMERTPLIVFKPFDEIVSGDDEIVSVDDKVVPVD